MLCKGLVSKGRSKVNQTSGLDRLLNMYLTIFKNVLTLYHKIP